MIGTYLRHLRKAKGLTLSLLAQKIGISPQRLSDYEAGRHRPSAARLEKLEDILEAEVALPPELSAEAGRRTAPPTEDSMFEPVYQATWTKHSRAYFELQRRIRFDRFPAWFCGMIPCDSGLEYLAWAQLVVAGATPVVASPLERGFRRYPLLDHLGLALGNQLRPCFHWRPSDLECLIWPQVNLQTPGWSCRVDALVLVCREDRRVWCVAEVDGPSHALESDKKRDAQIAPKVLRFPGPEVKSLQFAALLLERLMTQTR